MRDTLLCGFQQQLMTFLYDVTTEATLVADVHHVIDKSRSRRGSAIFDTSKYPHLDEETFNELKKAFLIYDKEATGMLVCTLSG
jgi:hypothetical protein